MRKGRGEIKKVGDLFDKYKNTLVAPEKTVITTFCEVVEETLGIALDPKLVRYNPTTRTLSMRGRGPLKTEIQLHKTEIIAHIKGRIGVKNAPKELL